MTLQSITRPIFTLNLCGFMTGFCNFGLLSVLVLCLQQTFHVSDNIAYSMLGIYSALTFGLFLLGGYIGDRFLGIRTAALLGAALLTISHCCLTSHNIYIFSLGLGMTIIGMSLFKVNCVSLIGILSHDQSAKGINREKIFTWYYASVNSGAILSPIIYGVIAYSFGWSYAFIFTSLLFFLIFLQFILNKKIKQLLSQQNKSSFTSYALLLAAVLISSLLLLHPQQGSMVIILLFIGNIAFFIKLLLRENKLNRISIGSILLLNIFGALFFTFSFQITGSVTLFIDRNIDKTFFAISIPTSAFSALDPFFVVISAPFFVWLWRYFSNKGKPVLLTTKITLASLCAFITLIILTLAAILSQHVNHNLPILLLIFANLFIGAGEMCLTPPILAAISLHAPPHLRSTMMGSWYVCIAFAGFLASQLAKLSNYQPLTAVDNTNNSIVYTHAFMTMALIALSVILVILISKRFINRLFV